MFVAAELLWTGVGADMIALGRMPLGTLPAHVWSELIGALRADAAKPT